MRRISISVSFFPYNDKQTADLFQINSLNIYLIKKKKQLNIEIFHSLELDTLSKSISIYMIINEIRVCLIIQCRFLSSIRLI